jgi:hypothetical protein
MILAVGSFVNSVCVKPVLCAGGTGPWVQGPGTGYGGAAGGLHFSWQQRPPWGAGGSGGDAGGRGAYVGTVPRDGSCPLSLRPRYPRVPREGGKAWRAE